MSRAWSGYDDLCDASGASAARLIDAFCFHTFDLLTALPFALRWASLAQETELWSVRAVRL